MHNHGGVWRRLVCDTNNAAQQQSDGAHENYAQQRKLPQRGVREITSKRVVRSRASLGGLFAQHEPRYDIGCLTPWDIVILGPKSVPKDFFELDSPDQPRLDGTLWSNPHFFDREIIFEKF